MNAGIESTGRQGLSILMDGEEYALELRSVREIVRHEAATPVPRVPACVRGVVNLRGSVVPVIDLALGLGMPEARVGSETCLVIVELSVAGERALMALVVDAVRQVVELPESLEAAPAFGTRVPASHLLGLARWEGRLLPILDVERLLGPGGLLEGVAA